MAGHASASPALRADAAAGADDLLERSRQWRHTLLDGPITYFPIRHHSPACARHLSHWIDEVRPASIVIEGPPSFDAWTAALQHADCVGPVAILSTYRESDAPRAIRHSGLYPLCDYSPEWVALRKAATVGARVRFADLEFEDKVRLELHPAGGSAEDDEPAEEERPAGGSTLGRLLTEEPQLRYSDFIRRLVRRLGCRDFDELWDHLFEAHPQQRGPAEFVGTLATYCDLSRASHDPEQLRRDATLAREAVMARVIREEYQRLGEPGRRGAVLVVTGGFHTVALPESVRADVGPESPQQSPISTERNGSWLIRYSFDRLDTLSGYQSGMPTPGLYDAFWQAEQSGSSRRGAAAGLITTIARATRGKPIPHEASVTDAIEAVRMLDRLADLRGHPAPTRSDVLDAIGSTMRKESSAANDHLAAIVARVLAGDRVGRVPAGVSRPPILDDFLAEATRLRLPTDTIEPRSVTLELYRKAASRPASFFLHQLELLSVPYGSLVDGPDFIQGYRLGKLTEEWSVAWSPSTETALAELATEGDSVAGAAALRLLRQVEEWEDQGAARDAQAAVALLIVACRCGLHEYTRQILDVAREHLAEDGSFASVAAALSRLLLLRSAREPLEASRLGGLDDLVTQCYHRAVGLIDSLGTIPDDAVGPSLDGLLTVRELLADAEEEAGAADGRPAPLDGALFLDALGQLLDQRQQDPAPRSEVAGAAAGVLHAVGVLDADGLCDIVDRYLEAAVDDLTGPCGVVRGLLLTAREAFWRMAPLLRRIDGLLARWDDGHFANALPHLRYAFSSLAPKEVDAVAERVSALHAVEELGPLAVPELTQEEAYVAVRATVLMNESLREDGLA